MRRNLNGVLLLDKPRGYTSNKALQVVKNIFKAKKAGHTGSLDPMASGMLPICFGEATKFTGFLLEANKEYIVTGKLGETTASGDSETEVIIKRDVGEISEKDAKRVLESFRGKILQLPPMYSAIKHNGRPLYKLARQGIEIKRDFREVNIHRLQLKQIGDGLIDLELKCSKGTYVRTLIADIGEALGCGAHVVFLKRLTVGPYKTEQMVTMKDLEQLIVTGDIANLEKLLLPVESMLADMPEVILSVDMIYYLLSGQPVLAPRVATTGLLRVKDISGRFFGIAEVVSDGKIAPKRMLTGVVQK